MARRWRARWKYLLRSCTNSSASRQSARSATANASEAAQQGFTSPCYSRSILCRAQRSICTTQLLRSLHVF